MSIIAEEYKQTKVVCRKSSFVSMQIATVTENVEE
jgi:hypothetical protein